MGKEYVRESVRARNKYLPLILDEQLPQSQREQHVQEWWQLSLQQLRSLQPSKTSIRVLFADP